MSICCVDAPVFDLLTVLRRVSRDLLASLVARYGVDRGACGRLFDWLTDSDFMTAIDDGGLNHASEPDVRLHDVIRHQAEQRLHRHALTRYRELHASVERYYRVQLNFDQAPEDGVSPYQYCVRYEDPGWQASSLEWLHHAGQVGDEDFPPVMRSMVRLFLDAFYWAECDFPLVQYQMFIDWARQRLDELREEGRGEVASNAMIRMNRLFAPYWARVGRAPDNPEGFPAQPAREDLGRTDSEFAETVLWVLDTMHAELTEPLDGPLLLPERRQARRPSQRRGTTDRSGD